MQRYRVIALAAPLPTLTGCGPGLAGAWSGSWDCPSSLQTQVAVDIDREGRGRYAGQGLQTWSAQWVADDQAWSAWLELRSAWEIGADRPHGDQDIELTVMLTGADCERSADGEVETTDCVDLGVDTELIEPRTATWARWDGLDAIAAEIDFCSVELHRVTDG